MKNVHKIIKCRNSGITLIALIITIIILLILAGITIATLTGENGILSKATTASEENKKKEYEEILKIIGADAHTEKTLENLSTKEFMDIYEDKIKNNDNIKENLKEVKRKYEETIIVITKEGYIFLITEKNVEYRGVQTGELPPDLDKSNVEFELYPDSQWTNSNVTVTIKTRVEGYILEYSMDGTNWKIYKEPIIMKENGVIYARLTDSLEQTGGFFTQNINKIDKKGPTGNIQVSKIEKDTITVDVVANDIAKDEKNECSGIKGYCYSKDGGNSYTQILENSNYKFAELTPGTNYNLFVKVIDNAENETILSTYVKTSEPLYIVENGVLKNNLYTIMNAPYARLTQQSGFVEYKYSDRMAQLVRFGVSWYLQDTQKYTKLCFKVSSPWRQSTDSPGFYIFAGTTPVYGGENVSLSSPLADTSYASQEILKSGASAFTQPMENTITLKATPTSCHIGFQFYIIDGYHPGRSINIYELYLE